MTKYNRYAKRLEKAFLEAREEYRAAADALEKAEHEKQLAYSYFEEKFVGERAVKRARADATLTEARTNFDNVSRTVWENFNHERDRLTAELREAVRADAVVNPDEIDANTVELLKAGVCSVDDYTALFNRFNGNSTMTRLIGKYAGEAVKTMDNENERMKLNYVSNLAKNGDNAVMRSWNELSEAASILSGQAHGRGERGYTLAMNSRFEELTGAMIEAF